MLALLARGHMFIMTRRTRVNWHSFSWIYLLFRAFCSAIVCLQQFSPSSPHDALKHYFTFLKTDLFSYNWGFQNENFHKTGLPIHNNFFSITSNHPHPLLVGTCDSNSRLVMDEDDNGKVRLERVKPSRCIKASSYIPENRLNFSTTKGSRTKNSMKLVYQYMVIFFNF